MRKLILMLVGLALLCPAAHAQTAPQPATSAQPEAKAGPDARIRKVLDARKIEYELTKSGNFKVAFNLKSGRSQVAFITSETYRYMNLEIREIWSVAYRSATPLPAEVANRLLADNYDRKLSAWATRKDPDGYYAVFVTKLPADCGEDSFIAALRLTLEAADEMEKELTSKDEF
jgi:hypothetical protein